VKFNVHGNDLNYLLITPRISPFPYPKNFEILGATSQYPTIPPGFAYISSAIKAIHENVYNLNLEFESDGVSDAILKKLTEFKIQVVLTTGISRHFTQIKEVVDIVKRYDPNLIVIVGGGVISSNPEIAMKAFGGVDLGVVGEGEYTIQEIVKHLNQNKDIDEIRGIIFKQNGTYFSTPMREEIVDLDSLPPPDYEGSGYKTLIKHINSIFVVCGRSCPFHCSFCFHPSGQKYRSRSIDHIIAEIAFLAKRYQVKCFHLIGEGLFFNKKYATEFCEKIKPLGVEWGCTLHASFCTEELVRLMKESGCVGVCLGIESACDHILESMNKKTRFSSIERALRICRENRINVTGNFIFGDSQEDSQSVETTLHWWRKNRQYPIDLIHIMIYPGTAMYKQALEMGIIKDEVSYIQANCPQINISKLTDYQYRELFLRFSTEKAFYTYPPAMYSILAVDYHQRRTRISYTCSCGHKEDLSITGILLSNEFLCPSCYQTYSISLAEKYSSQYAQSVLNTLTQEYQQIGFWGIGVEMQLLLRMLKASNLGNILLIDKDARKQGLFGQRHLIHPPQALQDGNIKAVVLTPLAPNVGGDTPETEIRNFGVERIVSFQSFLQLTGQS
jgi:anaerobic magnesium-protoporphyrin IX monomethyl ester cyclase